MKHLFYPSLVLAAFCTAGTSLGHAQQHKQLNVKKVQVSAPVEAQDVPALMDKNGVEFQPIDQVNWSVDSIILGHVWGTAVVAVYGLASRMNSLYLNFSTSISGVFAPRRCRICRRSDIVAQPKDTPGLLAYPRWELLFTRAVGF